MFVGTTAETIQAAAAVVVAAGVAVAVFQLREARKQRLAELLIYIHKSWDELEDARAAVDAIDSDDLLKLAKKVIADDPRSATDPEKAQWKELAYVVNFFEVLGLLAKKGLVRAKTIDRLIGTTFVQYYEKWKSTLEWVRPTFPLTRKDKFFPPHTTYPILQWKVGLARRIYKRRGREFPESTDP